MIERWICPFCRNAIAELPYDFDPNVVESLLRDHLVERHPIRRRLSRSVRTALRHPVIPPKPRLCGVCGKTYEDGAHTEFGFAGVDAHGYVARGAAA